MDKRICVVTEFMVSATYKTVPIGQKQETMDKRITHTLISNLSIKNKVDTREKKTLFTRILALQALQASKQASEQAGPIPSSSVILDIRPKPAHRTLSEDEDGQRWDQVLPCITA
jgi:hypothetical protein